MSRWLTHWGLSEAAFSKEIGDADLWVSTSRKGTLERLVETCQERGHAVLVGEPGVGKTCVLRAMRHRLPADGFRLTYCHNVTLGRRDFYRHVCLALGLSPSPPPPPRSSTPSTRMSRASVPRKSTLSS